MSEDDLLMTCEWQLRSSVFDTDPDYMPLAVIINGNDRQHAFRIGFGAMAKVCMNGMITAERVVCRKHTRHWPRDLAERIRGLLDEQGGWYAELLAFLQELKDYRPEPEPTHSFLIKSMRMGVISSSEIKKVLDIFEEPTYEEYEEGSLYTLFSAYTEVLRETNPLAMSRKTMTLHEMMKEEMRRPDGIERRQSDCPLLGAIAASPDFEVRITRTPSRSVH